jgi:hypothetical protein
MATISAAAVNDDLAKWELIPDGIYYRIKLSGTEFYLSGEGPEGSIPNGRNVHLWEWADSDLQRWEMIPDGEFMRLRCAEDDIYLSGSGEDDNIHLWGWVGSDLQRWEIQDFIPEACEGDFDGNGEVNDADLSTFVVDFGSGLHCVDTRTARGISIPTTMWTARTWLRLSPISGEPTALDSTRLLAKKNLIHG